MLSFPRLRLALGILALALLCHPEASRADSKRHTIETIDGVKLKANLWTGGKDGATVILLHNFDKTGGDSTKDGWNALAEALNKAGHTVISFDFRGHGQSLEVDPDKFWHAEFGYNSKYVKFKRDKEGKLPTTITTADITPNYYPFLVNDISAVRAFLDKQNDAGNINTKNIIVIGAGQGATLGALWMESEMRRRQAVPNNPLIGVQASLTLPPGAFQFKEPAGRDLAAGIFLTPSPTLGGQNVPLQSWLKDLGKEHKVPLAFISGKDDKDGSKYALTLLTSISPNYKVDAPPPKELPFTGEKTIADTKLKGSELLTAELGTQDWIVKDYLKPMIEKRTIIAQETQAFEKYPSFWMIGTARVPARLKETDASPRPLPLGSFGINR
jgi:alpha-beta hydrolase superfamily lysophospholipase